MAEDKTRCRLDDDLDIVCKCPREPISYCSERDPNDADATACPEVDKWCLFDKCCSFCDAERRSERRTGTREAKWEGPNPGNVSPDGPVRTSERGENSISDRRAGDA